jgi:sugar/nucleoside kinase (ribokinase family)
VLDEKFTYPQPNQYAEIGKCLTSIGGEAVNSAIMLSKLGIKSKLDGNWINPQKAEIIFNILKPFDIDISRLTVKENYGTEEIVITDRDSRTVLGNYAAFHSGEKQWNTPNEDDIMGAKMVAIDPYFKVESPIIAQWCVKHEKPYVTIDCKYEDFLTQNAEAVIISHELRDQAYPEANMAEIFEKYLGNCKGLIIFTFGSDELWYGRKGQPIRNFKPYKIKPIDTTGAGDTFRAGILYGQLKSMDDEATIAFASAVAACVCLTIPHSLNAPKLEGILKFMEENKRS